MNANDVFLLADVCLYYSNGERSVPYVVSTGLGAAAKRLIKKQLLESNPTVTAAIVVKPTSRGEQAIKLMAGILNSSAF